MFNFFDVIINFLSTIVGFVISLLEMLFYIIGFIAQGVVYAFACITYLPSWVLPFVMAAIGFSVIMIILNRGK